MVWLYNVFKQVWYCIYILVHVDQTVWRFRKVTSQAGSWWGHRRGRGGEQTNSTPYTYFPGIYTIVICQSSCSISELANTYMYTWFIHGQYIPIASILFSNLMPIYNKSLLLHVHFCSQIAYFDGNNQPSCRRSSIFASSVTTPHWLSAATIQCSMRSSTILRLIPRLWVTSNMQLNSQLSSELTQLCTHTYMPPNFA